MQSHMNVPWHMGGVEWFELAFFWLAVLLIVSLFSISLLKQKAVIKPSMKHRGWWRNYPETRLLVLALPIELLWEIAQFPLFDVWHQNDWSYILYGLAHCTLGDLLILFFIYEFLALIYRDRFWYEKSSLARGLLFTLLGVGYTVYSEIMNVRIKGTWGYTELMPLIPVINVGGMPFLQWLLIPPFLLWLMRTMAPPQA